MPDPGLPPQRTREMNSGRLKRRSPGVACMIVRRDFAPGTQVATRSSACTSDPPIRLMFVRLPLCHLGAVLFAWMSQGIVLSWTQSQGLWPTVCLRLLSTDIHSSLV
jgi:hypothetical protein